MDPAQLQRMLARAQGGGAMPQDGAVYDSAETIHISSLSLLKMLKHGNVYFHESLWLIVLYRTSWCSDGGHGSSSGSLRG